MWDIYWIKKAACITKGPWGDRASICLHRTLFPRLSTPTSVDTIMCQTWIRTHSLRGVGDLHMALHGKTGAHTAWHRLTLSPHPWTTHLPDRSLTARPSTVTCILQDLRRYSRRRRTSPLHRFLLTERDATRTSGWAKLHSPPPQVRSLIFQSQ